MIGAAPPSVQFTTNSQMIERPIDMEDEMPITVTTTPPPKPVEPPPTYNICGLSYDMALLIRFLLYLHTAPSGVMTAEMHELRNRLDISGVSIASAKSKFTGQ
jgi:hypothetical protein